MYFIPDKFFVWIWIWRVAVSQMKITVMEKNNILQADFLDILFEGRNKEYGAYDLRKTYNRRMRIALTATALMCLLLVGGYLLAGTIGNTRVAMFVTDKELSRVDIPEKQPEPPPVEPPKQTPPPVETIKNLTPRIVKDEQVKEEDMPPPVEDLEDAKIGSINQQGIADDGIVAPPVETEGKGIVEAPKKEEEDYEKVFVSVQIESEYAEGKAAWERFLNKNLRYPQEAADQEIQGDVYVQFLVDTEGNISNVEAISGPDELRAEAVRVIRKSGKWTAAIQNGRKVKSWKKQPIKFRIATE